MKKDSEDLLRGILLAHLILFLHLLFIAGLGLVVIFFTVFLSTCSGFFWAQQPFYLLPDFSVIGTLKPGAN
ncbi:MAG: hypothetical protein OET81_14015, partial [Desulfobacteraceae bacterium]|nr:hypothetical protein [Desulfobacteraceae bacterium]